jgi:hypothetical protein
MDAPPPPVSPPSTYVTSTATLAILFTKKKSLVILATCKSDPLKILYLLTILQDGSHCLFYKKFR